MLYFAQISSAFAQISCVGSQGDNLSEKNKKKIFHYSRGESGGLGDKMSQGVPLHYTLNELFDLIFYPY